jgi:ABC-type spermidine/putrescine transport system permease subunit II
MRAVALGPAASLVWLLAMAPVLACMALGAPGLGHAVADPVIVAAALRSLLVAEAAVTLGWPVGVLAALTIWDAPFWLRRVGLGAALLVLLVPAALSGRGLVGAADASGIAGAHVAADLLAHVAPAAGLVTLVLTAALNRLDPRTLASAASSGATPGQAIRLVVLPPLAMPLALSAASAFALAVSELRLDHLLAPLHHPTLAALLDQAVRQADTTAAPEALLLTCLAAAPLPPLGLLALLLGRRFPGGQVAAQAGDQWPAGNSSMSARSAIPSP